MKYLIFLVFLSLFSCTESSSGGGSAGSNFLSCDEDLSQSVKNIVISENTVGLKVTVCNDISVPERYSSAVDLVILDNQIYSNSDDIRNDHNDNLPSETQLISIAFNFADENSNLRLAKDLQLAFRSITVTSSGTTFFNAPFGSSLLDSFRVEYNQSGKSTITIGELNELLSPYAFVYF